MRSMAMMILALLACAGSARAAKEMCVVCALNGETEPDTHCLVSALAFLETVHE